MSFTADDMKAEEKPVRICCFDFDGQIAGQNLADLADWSDAWSQDEKDEYLEALYQSNQGLWEPILRDASLYSETLMCSISLRQSQKLDKNNSRNNCSPSSFVVLEYFSGKMGIPLDKFLMPDVLRTDGRGDGATWADACNPAVSSEDQVDYPPAHYDAQKILQLYTLMQRAVVQRPERLILLQVFDDKEEYLAAMLEFYSKYPKLLSKDLTLQLLHHGDKECGSRDEIGRELVSFDDSCVSVGFVGGQGMPHPTYRDWVCNYVRLLWMIGGESADQQEKLKTLLKNAISEYFFDGGDDTSDDESTATPTRAVFTACEREGGQDRAVSSSHSLTP